MPSSRLVVVLAVALASCHQPARPPGRGSADSDENQAILGKLQGYLGCLRDHSQSVFRVADIYRQRQGDPAAGSDGRGVIEPPPDPDKCIKAIAAARVLSPPLPELDAAANRFATALQRVFALTTQAHGYLDPGAKTHDPARGRALQPELSSAFAAFDTAQAALFDQVYQINYKVHVDQVARMEQRDGRTLPVRIETMMLRAEELARFAATPWDRVDQLDLAVFDPALDRFENAVEELASFAAAHPKDADVVPRFWSFVEDARGCVTAGRQLAHRVRDHIAYSDADRLMVGAGNEAGIVGSPAALARAYNTVVEDVTHQ